MTDISGLCENLRHIDRCLEDDHYWVIMFATKAADTLERQAAEIERMRGQVAAWAEQIDAISWTVNTSALDGLISEMRRTALTGEDND